MVLNWGYVVSMPMLIWYSVPFIFGLFLARYWRNHKRDRCNVPSVSSIPLLITLYHYFIQRHRNIDPGDYFQQFVTALCHLYQKERMIQVGWVGRKFILCFGANEIEGILRSSSALDRERIYSLFEIWLGRGLLLSGANKWKKRRKMLNPAFHFQILRNFLVIFNDHSNVLIEKLKKADGNVVYILRFLQNCVLDIIIESAMGLRMNAQNEECASYSKATKHIFEDLMNSFLKPHYWIKPLYDLTRAAKRVRENVKIAHDFTNKIIQKKKEELRDEKTEAIFGDFQYEETNLGTKKKRILIDLLLYYHFTDKSFKEEDVREEVDTFTTSGVTTVGISASWALHLLGWHEEIQDKVYQELKHVFGEDRHRVISVDDLNEMKYLECVIKETLRLYPVVSIIGRETSEDMEIGDYFIPAHSSVVIPIYSIHRDSSFYPNPEIFDPDRFTPENSSTRHPFAYIPFSAGARNCIGTRFAMMAMKTMLAYVLRNFKVRSLDHRDELVFAADVLLHPNKPLRLKLEERLENTS